MSGVANNISNALEKTGSSLTKLGNVAGDVMDGIQAISNSVIGKVFDKAGELAVAGAKMAIEASSFREDTIAAFEAITGSQEAAIEIFDRADALAGDLALK